MLHAGERGRRSGRDGSGRPQQGHARDAAKDDFQVGGARIIARLGGQGLLQRSRRDCNRHPAAVIVCNPRHSLVRFMNLPRLAAAILILLGLSACGKGDRQSIAGRYEFLGSSAKGSLVLFTNRTYRLCRTGDGCETGVYHVELSDDPFDRVGFSGRALSELAGGGVGNLRYAGPGCPCIYFGPDNSGARFEKVSE